MRLHRDLEAGRTSLRSAFPRTISDDSQSRASLETFAPFLEDANRYILELLTALPKEDRGRLRPSNEVLATNEVRTLLALCFEGSGSRQRFEAQRKLYLARLLFEIDHCRLVRDGQRHRELIETSLRRWLEEGGAPCHDVEICCSFEADGNGEGRIRLLEGREPEGRCWRFELHCLPATPDECPIEIYDLRCRFKRDLSDSVPVASDAGILEVGELRYGPSLGRRSGSILSKMIRRGYSHPYAVTDLIGTRFIVSNRKQAYALERRLVRWIGGPSRVRDRVDTTAGEKERSRLSARSAPGFKVLKQVADLLVQDPHGRSPYLVPVEFQIYPLVAYLETLHGEHYASHTAYKQRQLMMDLLPILFPLDLYERSVQLPDVRPTGSSPRRASARLED